MSEGKDDTYQSIAGPSQGLYKEKGSKFISLAFPVSDEEEIETLLSDVRKQYHDARHHCYAWRFGIEGEPYRVNDDGEPSGSAGLPILGQLRSAEISDTLIIVVRYFGGVKLGVGGLISAYKAAARDAIDQAKTVNKVLHARFRFSFEYPKMNDVMRFIRETGLEIETTDFQISCKLIAGIPLGRAAEIEEKAGAFYGINYERMDDRVIIRSKA